MSKRPRRNHSAAFKAKVAIDALADGKTIAEVALKHDVHPNQVTEWRRQLIERAAGVFGGATAPETAPEETLSARQKGVPELCCASVQLLDDTLLVFRTDPPLARQTSSLSAWRCRPERQSFVPSL